VFSSQLKSNQARDPRRSYGANSKELNWFIIKIPEKEVRKQKAKEE